MRAFVEPRTDGRVRAAIERGLRFLRARQFRAEAGGGGSGRVGTRYPVAVTSLAGLALLGYGVQPHEGREPMYADMLVGCVDYLLAVAAQRRDGFITEFGTGDETGSRMHGHCYAVLFLTQVSGSLPKERQERVNEVIRKGILVIERAQSREGGWYYTPVNLQDRDEASVTVCALQALRAADNIGFVVDKRRVDRALGYLKKCQDPRDGSFRYSLSDRENRTSFCLTAASVSTLNAAGVYESPELRRGLDYLRRRLEETAPKVHRAVEQEFFFYGAFYASQAFFQDGGELWATWYPRIRDHLLAIERRDEAGRAYWESRFGEEYATATALLILELPLGYLPIFQR